MAIIVISVTCKQLQERKPGGTIESFLKLIQFLKSAVVASESFEMRRFKTNLMQIFPQNIGTDGFFY